MATKVMGVSSLTVELLAKQVNERIGAAEQAGATVVSVQLGVMPSGQSRAGSSTASEWGALIVCDVSEGAAQTASALW